MKHKNFDNIKIKDICVAAGINRTTFYAHYFDINDFMIKLEESFNNKIKNIFFEKGSRSVINGESFTEYFKFILENRYFYLAFFDHADSISCENSMINSLLDGISEARGNKMEVYKRKTLYRMIFFGSGLKEITHFWLRKGCIETPEEMAGIITTEYFGREKKL
ncbi:MAG: TetR-like C-terminal domain-containing protein [Bacilli bacterium]|nr:TetR-like C-terminal domain-containing protein [Bacilli bacterium]